MKKTLPTLHQCHALMEVLEVASLEESAMQAGKATIRACIEHAWMKREDSRLSITPAGRSGLIAASLRMR